MPELIDIALTPEEVASIETMLASLEDAMPFLIGLSPERVKALFKLGPQSEAFVQKTLEAAEQHARLLPASTPVAAMRRDAELRETLRPIRARVARLLELLDGTMILAGADLMKSASAVYRTLRIHAKGEGIESTLEDLGKRFAKRRRAEISEPIEDTERARAATEITRPVEANGRALPTQPIEPEPPVNAIGHSVSLPACVWGVASAPRVAHDGHGRGIRRRRRGVASVRSARCVIRRKQREVGVIGCPTVASSRADLNDGEAIAVGLVAHGPCRPGVKTQKRDRFHGRAHCSRPCIEISPETRPDLRTWRRQGRRRRSRRNALFNQGPLES